MAEETKRHNTVMEEIARKRLAREEAVGVLDAARSATSYQMELFQQYMKLPKEMPLEDIANTFPQFICFFKPSDLTDDQKSRFSARYNKYNSDMGLPNRVTF